MNRKFLVVMLFMITSILYSFEEGFIWGLRANFNGSLTLPSISQEDLNKMGAAYMKGAVGYTMDGEAELGYLFGAERWFGKEKSDFSKFSGMSLYVSIGVGNGFTGLVAGNTINGINPNMFINVKYTPVISFGIGSKLYLLESRMAIGLQLGGKLIADTSPEYLAYSDMDLSAVFTNITLPQVGEIIVTDFMKKNMNPVMFSIKLMLEYNQPINDRVEVVLGIYTRFNIYKPKYITMPDSLLEMIKKGAQKPNFSTETPMPTYYINSLDFGLTLGLQFRG
ncbi:hypothetical protein EPJ79_01310 [Brachyspira aalborgi]|uniref:Uncharacterized protein n=1 Tax=Brachyspira aalborgi TaxID=29522 RepID=A0A5C8D382_9SPIR|nr:hypothetical protein [Brachyspira aalborgi]TXJ19824.1 hypothetical protein EPJ79_01310 [Brachyspira aalborgi]